MALTVSEKVKKIKPSSTLAITAKAKELKEQGIDIVGFGAGEPDFNTPDNICQVAIEAIQNGFTKYTPASGTVALKKAICEKFKRDNNLNYEPAQIVASNGGKHALSNVLMAICNPGDEVLIPVPYWLSYPEMVAMADGVPVYIHGSKERNYKITVEQLQEAVTDKTKALILNSPSNPTGMMYTKDELQKIADFAIRNDIYVISDEIYENLIYGEAEHVSIASLGDEIYKRTITVNGVAKSYAMTGWRIGFTASSVELAKLMSSMQSHQTSNPNSIAQAATVEAMIGPQTRVAEMAIEFDKRREYMVDRLSKMPHISFIPPQGAFYVFVDCSQVCQKSYGGKRIKDAATIAEILIQDYQTAVIPCADFGVEDHIRLSYAISMEAIEKGMNRLEKFLSDIE